MQTNKQQKIIAGLFLVGAVCWLTLLFSGSKTGFYDDLYSCLMNVIPFAGGLIAIQGSFRWKLRSSVGKGMFFAGLGLFLWSLGGFVWSYYNFFLHIPTPYPSLADVFYFPSIFLYCAGTIYLSRAAGADFGLRHNLKRKLLITVGIVAVLGLLNYGILARIQADNIIEHVSFLEKLLDIGYPLGDLLSLCTAVVISGLYFQFLVKEYRVAVSTLLAGLAAMFVSDLYFSYSTAIGTHRNGGFNDLIFTFATTLLIFGVLGFYSQGSEDEREKLHIFSFLKY